MRRFWCLVSLLTLAPLLPAQGVPGPRVQFSGFGTLAVAATDSHQVAFVRDVTQPAGVEDQPNAKADSRLGLQCSVRFADSLLGTLQVLSKYRYDGTFHPDLSIASLAWNPVSNVQVRVGRMGFELFENGVARDVGYSYLWIRPPTESYALDTARAIDGVELAQTFDLGPGTSLTLKALGGYSVGRVVVPRVQDPLDYGGGKDLSVMAFLRSGPWRLRLGASQMGIPHDYPYPITLLPQELDAYAVALRDPALSGTGAQFQIQGGHSRCWMAGLVFEQGPVQAEGFFQRVVTNRPLVPSFQSGYLSLGYRLDRVVPYAVLSRLVEPGPALYLGELPARLDPGSQALVGGIDQLVRGLAATQTTWSLGLRWDFAAQAAFKLQVDLIHNPSGTGVLQMPEPGYGGHLTVMTAGVDFVFGGGRR